MMLNHDLVIVGGGPAGMAAAVAAYDAGCQDVVILDREPELGGILMQCIHNGFGLHKLGRELTGPEYAAVYVQKVKERNIKVYAETMVTGVSPEKIVTAQNRQGILKIQAKAVILAMGCRERSRGALNICGSRCAGIYSAGTAQKLVNCMGYQVGKRVVILGSGDIGLIMARRMSYEGAKVEAVCEVMPYSGGLTRNIVQCLEDFDIPLYLSTTVVQIHGKERLEGVTIAQVDERRKPIEETKRYIPCDTLLLSVGLIPENELTRKAGIAINPITNGPSVNQYMQTSAKSVFACGNVVHVNDLVDNVSEESARAGKYAARYAAGKLGGAQKTVECVTGRNVRYLCPQSVDANEKDSKVSLYFRVLQPENNVKLIARCGDTVIAKHKEFRVNPGEMCHVTVNTDMLTGDQVTVEVIKED